MDLPRTKAELLRAIEELSLARRASRESPGSYRCERCEGCIAVSNTDMVEIWLMTPPDTPIEIRP